jgi:hypothetical protein
MKYYASNLHALGPGAGLDRPSKEWEEMVWRLAGNLLNGLQHLHTHDVVHRDIKPHNIFFNADTGEFVVGDLGIAHFDPEAFAKLAHTRATDRLANYLFSAPEQSDSKNSITPAADLYSFAQVLQWFVTGKTIRGLGRPRFALLPDSRLTVLDKIVDKCLQNSPTDRFQSVGDIRAFIQAEKEPKVDPWKNLHDFDDAIRQSFPKIGNVLSCDDPSRIEKFIDNFRTKCNLKEFWYVLAEGGDNYLEGLEQLHGSTWLLNGDVEMLVTKLLLYRDSNSAYKNFFILLFGPDEPFALVNPDGERIERGDISKWTMDEAELFDGKIYVAPDETKNGYYELGGVSHPVDHDRFQMRTRYLTPYAVLIAPGGTAPVTMRDREPVVELMQSAITHGVLKEDALKTFFQKSKGHVDPDILRWR